MSQDKETDPIPQPVALDDMQATVEQRRADKFMLDRYETLVRRENATLLVSLQAAGVKRHQLASGVIVQIIQQKPRQSVKPELLLQHGVTADIIKACTVESPVAPFVRVDYPETGEMPTTGDSVVDTRGPIADAPTRPQ